MTMVLSSLGKIVCSLYRIESELLSSSCFIAVLNGGLGQLAPVKTYHR